MAKRVQSPSSINTFKQCKRKYFYQYIEKLPGIPNIHQVRGNIAHTTLENFFDIDISLINKSNYTLKIKENIQKLFLHSWNTYKKELQKVGISSDQEKFYFEETMLMLLNWTNHFIIDLTKKMMEKEVSLQEAFTELTPIREQKLISEKHSVRGFIDAIQHVDDKIHIIDYKTNARFDFKDSIRLQLAIYSLLYYELYNKMPDKVGIFFLRNKLKMINVDERLLELAKREIAMIHEHTSKTEQMNEYPRTVTGLCKWSTGKCDFYKVCDPHNKN
jgi:ATP-dependent exoDNAse (exonuclease V) beta subunit